MLNEALVIVRHIADEKPRDDGFARAELSRLIRLEEQVMSAFYDARKDEDLTVRFYATVELRSSKPLEYNWDRDVCIYVDTELRSSAEDAVDQKRGQQRRVGDRVELRSSSEEVVGVVLDGLRHGDKKVRISAADLLAVSSKDRAKIAVSALSSSLKEDRDADVRKRAAWTLRLLAERTELEACTRALIEGMKDEDAGVRASVLGELRQLGDHAPDCPIAPQVIQALTRSLSDKNLQVRLGVVEYIHSLGDRAQSARPALEEALKGSTDDAFREAASAALRRMTGQEERLRNLIRCLRNAQAPQPDREAAAEALAQFGSSFSTVMPELVTCLKKDPSARVRSKAAASLFSLGAKNGREAHLLP